MAKSPFAGVISSAKRVPIEQDLSSRKSLLPLDSILPRFEDTRAINQAHVEALSESIAAVGLIQPIAVDSNGRLLAGGHRLAAIEHLKINDNNSYIKHFPEGVPVRRYDFDASIDKTQALAIEATENEKRRDYTPAEVRELADKLEAAGYHRSKGRAKKGQKSVGPTLALIVGKSQRTIERYLAGDEDKDTSDSLNPTNDVFNKNLQSTLRALKKLRAVKVNSNREQKIQMEVEALIKTLEAEV